MLTASFQCKLHIAIVRHRCFILRFVPCLISHSMLFSICYKTTYVLRRNVNCVSQAFPTFIVPVHHKILTTFKMYYYICDVTFSNIMIYNFVTFSLMSCIRQQNQITCIQYCYLYHVRSSLPILSYALNIAKLIT